MHAVPGQLGRDRDQPARRGGLNRVDDQIPVHPAQCKKVALDEGAGGGELAAQRQAGGFGMLLHRFDDFAQRPIDFDWEPFERNRPGDVAQVVEHPLDDDHLALDGALEGGAVLEVVVHLLNQLAAVPDVLDRVRQVVDQAGGDPAEHRLPFLLTHVLLQLDDAVGHRVEGVAELLQLVVSGERDPLVEAPFADGQGGALEREDAGDEGAGPEVADHQRAEERRADDVEELGAQLAIQPEGFGFRLLHTDSPVQAVDGLIDVKQSGVCS